MVRYMPLDAPHVGGFILRAALLAFAVIPYSGAQEAGDVRIRSGVYSPAAAAMISAEANLVELGATVRDRDGKVVGGLQKRDFELFDDGKLREITFFSEQKAANNSESAAAPGASSATADRYIALFFDDTHARQTDMHSAQQAAEKLIATGLQPGDLVGIFTTSGNVTVEFTADAKALLAAIARLRHAPPQIGSGGDMQCPSFTPYQAYVVAHHQDQRAKDVATAEAIACYCVGGDESCPKAQPATAQGAAETMWGQFESQSTNALDQLRAVVQHLAGTPGSRLLILISNGFPAGDMYQRTNAIIDAALAARIVVNALNSEGLMGQSPEARGASDGIRYRWATETSRMRQTILSELMSSVSAATGGQMILNNNDLTGALKKLTDTPETSYLLGFAPAGAPDAKYHVLKLVLKKSDGFRVESRPGYFAARLGKKTETAQQRIDRVMLSKETLQEIPANVRVTAAPAGVLVLVNVDAKPLKFVNQGDKNVQQLTFVAVVQDASGNYVTGKQSVMDLALSTARLAVLQAEGIRTTETFSVPPGEYQVRLLIREAVQNHMAASNTAVEVH